MVTSLPSETEATSHVVCTHVQAHNVWHARGCDIKTINSCRALCKQLRNPVIKKRDMSKLQHIRLRWLQTAKHASSVTSCVCKKPVPSWSLSSPALLLPSQGGAALQSGNPPGWQSELTQNLPPAGQSADDSTCAYDPEAPIYKCAW